MKQIMVDTEKCLACNSCELACAVAHSQSGRLVSAISEDPLPQSRVHVEGANGIAFPVQCRHCGEPNCVHACITGCLERDEATGVVNHDSNRCIGCWMCAMVCPFGAVTRHVKGNSVIKCDRCTDRQTPACVEACPVKALNFISIDEAGRLKRKDFLLTIKNQEVTL